MVNAKKAIAAGAIAVALIGSAVAGQQIFQSGASTTLASRNGTLQAQYHNQQLLIVPFLGPFKKGECGPAIKIMDRALIHIRIRKNKPASCFGQATKAQVIMFQEKIHYKPTGIYTLAVHHALAKRGGYIKVDRLTLKKIELVRINALIRRNVLVIAGHAHLVGTNLVYSQSGSRSDFPPWPRLPPATDCSGFVTWVAWQAGFGGRVGYFGPGSSVGWTGTLANQGIHVPLGAKLRVGDLLFYGDSYPWGHVAMYIGNNNVISHGGAGVNILPYNYRSFGEVRRYIY